MRKGYDDYQFHVVFHSIHNFCAVNLSALYLDIIKDRLYVSAPSDPKRRAAQTVCFETLTALVRLLALLVALDDRHLHDHRVTRGEVGDLAAEPRDLFRRPLAPDELKAFEAVVFDPPRQGAEAQSRELAKSAVPTRKFSAVAAL